MAQDEAGSRVIRPTPGVPSTADAARGEKLVQRARSDHLVVKWHASLGVSVKFFEQGL